MRIDKFLWSVRLFKTRSLATEAVKAGKVSLNDQLVKPSKEVSIGQSVWLKKHGYSEAYKVLDIPKSRVGPKLVSGLIEDITPPAEAEKREFLSLAKNLTRQKGLGRPTKKDRRDLDSLL